MFMAFVDHKNNAYHFFCDIVGHRMYRTACHKRMEDNGELTPELCKGACRVGSCPAKQMREEEKEAGEVIYYVDRDDAGPGIASRAEVGHPQRTEMTIRTHHAILKDLGREPISQPEPLANETPQKAVLTPVTASSDVIDMSAAISKKAASL